jgi:ribonuclease HII
MARYIIGIDEVGRGALAGPVAVAAVAISRKARIANRQLGRLRDSKKLTPLQRERWAEYIKNHPHIWYSVARVYSRGVDNMNIARAANLAALRAFCSVTSTFNLQPLTYVVRLDGGLFLGNGAQPGNAKTVVRGDEKFTAVKLASILAKVSRDGYMKKLHKRYPQYGFAVHKGYGTKAHLIALRKFGVSSVHRLTFLRFS